MCAGHAVFSHTKVASETRCARNAAFYSRNGCGWKVGGVRRRVRLWSPMPAYARLWSPMGGYRRNRRWLNALEQWLPGGAAVGLGGRFASD